MARNQGKRTCSRCGKLLEKESYFNDLLIHKCCLRKANKDFAERTQQIKQLIKELQCLTQ